MTQNTLPQWLANYFGTTDFTLTPLAGDASFRRYFRVSQGAQQLVAMDASVEREKCSQFIAIADTLRANGLCTPEIYTHDLDAGFLLLTDFGDDVFLKKITAENTETLYGQAVDSLLNLSQCKTINNYTLPPFTQEFMQQELYWFQEWFLEKHLNLSLSPSVLQMLATLYELLASTAASQTQVLMHRDYHSANLMILPENKIGILDFQDAFIGPVTYDLVSLLRDCYVECPEEIVKKLLLQYRASATIKVSEAEFLRWFDWMGMQRHMKALLTFSRKYHRDHNANYLQHIPLTMKYLLRVSERYPEFKAFNLLIRDTIMEKLACAQ